MNFIINPISGEKLNLFTEEGLFVLEKFINKRQLDGYLMEGGRVKRKRDPSMGSKKRFAIGVNNPKSLENITTKPSEEITTKSLEETTNKKGMQLLKASEKKRYERYYSSGSDIIFYVYSFQKHLEILGYLMDKYILSNDLIEEIKRKNLNFNSTPSLIIDLIENFFDKVLFEDDLDSKLYKETIKNIKMPYYTIITQLITNQNTFNNNPEFQNNSKPITNQNTFNSKPLFQNNSKPIYNLFGGRKLVNINSEKRANEMMELYDKKDGVITSSLGEIKNINGSDINNVKKEWQPLFLYIEMVHDFAKYIKKLGKKEKDLSNNNVVIKALNNMRFQFNDPQQYNEVIKKYLIKDGYFESFWYAAANGFVGIPPNTNILFTTAKKNSPPRQYENYFDYKNEDQLKQAFPFSWVLDSGGNIQGEGAQSAVKILKEQQKVIGASIADPNRANTFSKLNKDLGVIRDMWNNALKDDLNERDQIINNAMILYEQPHDKARSENPDFPIGGDWSVKNGYKYEINYENQPELQLNLSLNDVNNLDDSIETITDLQSGFTILHISSAIIFFDRLFEKGGADLFKPTGVFSSINKKDLRINIGYNPLKKKNCFQQSENVY